MLYFDRYCFPFGRPEGALKATLSLLERVSTLSGIVRKLNNEHVFQNGPLFHTIVICHPYIMLTSHMQVLMKDIVTPVPPEEVRGMIKKCLENAALLNYTRLSAETRIEGLLLFIPMAV